MATNDDAEVCPLCLETLDITDLACQFCTCGYSMCLWCWHRIREDAAKQSLPARCPNCRTVYQQDRVKMESIDANLLEDTRRRKKEDRKRTAVSQPKTRRDLANVRVVQRNLVYAVGLAMELCYEDTLMGPEYFGAFGKMVKQMSVNRMGPYGSSVSRNGPTGSAYITFKRPEDAKRCIEAVNGAVWGGKQVKACFGTTKYCNAFLKGVICNNPECLYLHDIAEDTDSYTKEETKSTKFINLTHAASMTRQPSQSPITGTPPPPPPPGQGRLQGAASGTLPRQFSFSQMSEASSGLPQTSDGWDSAGPSWLGSPSTASSWLAKAASSHALPTTLPMPSAAPVPPSADEQEWPELGGSTSNMAQQAACLLVSRRSSGRVAPPGFSGPVAAPSTTSESASHAARHKGPPPGFGPAAQLSNGNVPPGFPSHSGSDSSDFQGHSWSVSQAAPQQWASFHPSQSSPNAAGSDHHTPGLHQSHSTGLVGYPCISFAMPGLSDLQNLREQSGYENSLFSGSSNQPACVPDHSGSSGHEVAPGWDAYTAHSTSPFFDPAIVNASSAALRETDPAGSAAAPVQMPLPPTLTPSQATAVSAPQAANGQADASEAGNRDSDASAPAPGLQTPPKNGKRRRGGRGTKSGAAHRSPQTRGRGRGANAGHPSNADLALLQQQYDQAKSQLAISGAQLAQAQEKFQNIHI
ncbi:hypothetical protein WJX79_008987 [Trebouxia sp. C0005]